MRLVTSAEMTAIDERAQSEFFIPGVVLMESAARAAWQRLRSEWFAERPRQSIVFVAGTGNNGGDALAMARYCAIEGEHQPVIILSKDALRGDARLQVEITRAMSIPQLLWSADREQADTALQNSDWIIDGLAGTGLSGPLRSPLVELAEAINRSGSPVASIDCPSGAGDAASGAAVKARCTMTLGLPKRCLYDPGLRDLCGTIEVVPFTIPNQLISDTSCSGELLQDEDLRELLPPMPATVHKGQRGSVGVYAGGTGTSGAAVLASRAALASGAGLVTLVASAEVHGYLSSQMVSVMVRPEEDEYPALVSDAARFGSAVIGPGWGTHSARAKALTEIVAAVENGVIDADGLTLLAGLSEVPALSGWVLTPHPAELGRLLGRSTDEVLSDFFGSSVNAAQQYNAIVVAKASTTVVARPDGRIAVVDGMNPALATAGSGDVLSGVIASLLARGLSAWDSARCGALAHSVAGRRLRDSAGLFRSSALPDAVASVMGEALFGA